MNENNLAKWGNEKNTLLQQKSLSALCKGEADRRESKIDKIMETSGNCNSSRECVFEIVQSLTGKGESEREKG